MKLRDVMHGSATVVSETATIAYAAQAMGRTGCGFVAVVRQGVPVGVVTGRDVATRITARGLDSRYLSVSSVMTSPVMARDDTELADAADLMRRSEVRRLVVTDEHGAVSGIVSLSDLLGGPLPLGALDSPQHCAVQPSEAAAAIPGLFLG